MHFEHLYFVTSLGRCVLSPLRLYFFNILKTIKNFRIHVEQNMLKIIKSHFWCQATDRSLKLEV